MILNNSRAEAFNACKVLAYNQEVEKLAAFRTADPLLVGSGFHAGLAVINSKSGDLEKAAQDGEDEYKKRAGWDTFLKEEKVLGEVNIRLVRNMIKAYGEHYLNENYQVLAPEVSFRVALPNTEHHCWYFHKLLFPDDPCAEGYDKHGRLEPGIYKGTHEQLEKKFCVDPRCRHPHYLVGTTDAIIQWNKAIWLQEHKTTAYDLFGDTPQAKNWIANWQLSTQASTYIYGIWKSLKIRPHGVLLNVVIKPRKNAVNPVFNFYREAFLRTEEQLLGFEREVSLLADDYENRMRTNTVWKNPHSCFNYNRRCDFHKSCVSGELQREAYVQRSPDYVNAAYYKVLGLEPPTVTEGELHVIE